MNEEQLKNSVLPFLTIHIPRTLKFIANGKNLLREKTILSKHALNRHLSHSDST